MGTTVEKLNKLKTTKEAIRTAINNKGGTLTTSNKFSDYATAIDNIQSGGGGSLKTLLDATKSAQYLFYSYYTSTVVDDLISYSDTENVTNMNSMFYACSKLTTIPQLNTSSCTSMSSMFRECFKLTTIPQLNTSSCTNMSSMFNSCNELSFVPQLNTSSCTDMHDMFYCCIKLTTIDITHMKITTGYNTYEFAYNCFSLTKLIIRNMDTIPTLNSNAFENCYHFYGTTNATYNPEGLKDGRIYVPDDKVDELKAATNWSVFADIIVPLSTLVE